MLRAEINTNVSALVSKTMLQNNDDILVLQETYIKDHGNVLECNGFKDFSFR